MKIIISLLAVSAVLSLAQCSDKNTPDDQSVRPRVNYDDKATKLMQQLAPQLPGTWALRRVHIQAQSQNSNQYVLGIKRDTVLQNFATLTVRVATQPRTTPARALYPEFEGAISFRGRSYPVYFSLIAAPERVVKNTGPQAHFLFSYDFPVGTRSPEPEEVYLSNVGIMDNFALEMLAGERSMTWRGLNRGVVRIEMEKQ